MDQALAFGNFDHVDDALPQNPAAETWTGVRPSTTFTSKVVGLAYAGVLNAVVRTDTVRVSHFKRSRVPATAARRAA
jgi:hypothetical protein